MKYLIGRYLAVIRETSQFTLKILLVALAIFAAGSIISILNRQRYLEIYRSTISLTNIAKDSGYSYVANIGRSDLSAEYQVSKGLLIEDNVVLTGRGYADIDYVQQVGKGSSLFWKDKIYFASSDNSDPRSNGKVYQISYPVIIRYFIAFPTYFITLLLFMHLLLVTTFKSAPVMAGNKRLMPYVTNNHRIIINSSSILLFLSLVGAAVMWLNQNNILIYRMKVSPITYIKPELGNAFYSDVRALNIKWDHEVVSLITVLENGQPLNGQSNASQSQIRESGLGAFSYWDGYVYFSSSDNTSPLSNNRSYQITYPETFSSRFAYISYFIGLTVFAGYFLLLFYIKGTTLFVSIIKTIDNHQLALSLLIIVAAYLIPRCAWFIDYQVPLLAFDSSSYFAPIKQYLSGTYPLFISRTVGYPTFLLLTGKVAKSLTQVVFVQLTITLLSSLALLMAIRITIPSFTLLAGIAIASHVAQPMLVANDFMILTESLYSSIIVLIIASVILLINKKAVICGSFLLSLLIAMAVLVRPSAIFLVSIYMLVLVFMLINRYALKNVLSLLFPLLLIFLLYLSYNNYTLGKYSFTFLGNATLFAVTAYMWEPAYKFSPNINNNLIGKFKSEILPEDKEIIEHSWDFNAFYRVTVPLIDKAFYAKDAPYIKNALLEYTNSQGNAAQQVDTLMGQIAIHAIKSHPVIYLKFFLMNAIAYFSDNSSWRVNVYKDISWHMKNMYFRGLVNDESISFVTRVNKPSRNIVIRESSNEVVVMPTVSVVMNAIFSNTLAKIFDCSLWTYLYFLVFISAIVLIVGSKAGDPDWVTLFLISSILFFSGVMYAAVTPITDRYPSPTRFIEVFSVLYFVYLICTKDQFKSCLKKRLHNLS